MENKTFAQFEGPHVYYDHKSIAAPDDEALMHAHSWCEITFVKQGRFSHVVGDQNYEIVGESILMFSRSGQVHKTKVNEAYPFERHRILFDDKKIFQDLCGRIPGENHVFNYERNNVIPGLFEKLELYYHSFEQEDFGDLLHLTIKELLYNLMITGKAWEVEKQPGGNSRRGAIMKNAIKYIDENITDDISIEGICEHLFVTKSHLHRLFMENLKVTPKKYILSKKMNLAQRKLCRGEKATEVAQELGYGDYSTFFRAYKKHFGYPPSDELVFDKILEVKSVGGQAVKSVHYKEKEEETD